MTFYIALGILVVYIIYSCLRYKCIPNSISDTFYLGNKWAFTFVIWAISFLTAPALISASSPSYSFLAFFTVAGLLFVGAAPHFKEHNERAIHVAGACIFGFFGQIWAFIHFSPQLLLTWVISSPLLATKQKTFWIEIICIINLVLAYLL